MVEPQSSKLMVRVRFPSSALTINATQLLPISGKKYTNKAF